MLRGFLSILLALLLLMGNAFADRYPPFDLYLEEVPAYGEEGDIEGYLDLNGYGSSPPLKYLEKSEELCLKAFIRVPGSETRWPKPTNEYPYVLLNNIEFSLDFTTGGDDIHATEIVLMVSHIENAMETDYEKAREQALCVVTLCRDENGNLTRTNAYRSDTPRDVNYGFCVGFYHQEGSAPGSPLSEGAIRELLTSAMPYTSEVRFYTVTGEVAKSYPIAKELGLSVAATAYLDGSAHDQEELDALIALCNNGLAAMAIVGNETIYKGTLSEENLLADIAYVRAEIVDPEIPVTTAEVAETWLNSEKLRNACDQIGVNAHPFFTDVTAEEAGQALADMMAHLIQVCGEKPVLITETGWPSGGDDKAGDWQQMAVMDEACWLRLLNEACWRVETVYWFELADEGWKAAEEGLAGANWGILYSDLTAKPATETWYWGKPWYSGD